MLGLTKNFEDFAKPNSRFLKIFNKTGCTANQVKELT